MFKHDKHYANTLCRISYLLVPIARYPLFIQYSYTAIGTIDAGQLKASIGAMPYNDENASLLAYLLPLLDAVTAIA